MRTPFIVLAAAVSSSMMASRAADPVPSDPCVQNSTSVCGRFEAIQGRVVPRPIRVTDMIIDAAGSLQSENRTRVLIALASHPGLTADGELRVIDAAKSLSSDNRTLILEMLARSVRYE